MSGFPFTAHEVARHMGGEVLSGNRAKVPGPGHSARDRSLVVTINPTAPDGFTVYSHAGDDWQECKDHVRLAMGLPTWSPDTVGFSTGPSVGHSFLERLAAREAAARQEQEDHAARIALALRVWAETVDPVGTIVETYLQSRGLSLPDAVIRGGHLRFHPATRFNLPSGEDGGKRWVELPAMVCLMTDPLTAEPRAIHRTAFAADGQGKSQYPGLGDAKKMLGVAAGTVIRLSPDEDVTIGLGLSEGIENGIAALCGGWSPIWAAGSAVNLGRFPVLAGVEALTLFADSGAAGVAAADLCGSRWADAGREVEARFPLAGDWNDAMREAG